MGALHLGMQFEYLSFKIHRETFSAHAARRAGDGDGVGGGDFLLARFNGEALGGEEGLLPGRIHLPDSHIAPHLQCVALVGYFALFCMNKPRQAFAKKVSSGACTSE